jgi:hypothetical protein
VVFRDIVQFCDSDAGKETKSVAQGNGYLVLVARCGGAVPKSTLTSEEGADHAG